MEKPMLFREPRRFDAALTVAALVLAVATASVAALFAYTVIENRTATADATPALRAIETLKKKVAEQPNNASLRVNLGEAFGVAGMHDEAIEQLEAALKLEPKHAVALLDLGLVAIDMEEWKTAEKYMHEVVKVTEDSQYQNVNETRELALFNLGKLGIQKREYEDAVGYFKAALRIRKDASDTYYHLAEAFRGMGEDDAAEEQLEIALAFDPNFAKAHYLLGRIYADRKDEVNAAVHLRRAVDLAPEVELAREALEEIGSAEEWLARAREALEAEDHELAVEAVLTARALQPESVEAAKLHGRILEGKGSMKAALEVYREAAKLDADDPEVKAAIARLAEKKS